MYAKSVGTDVTSTNPTKHTWKCTRRDYCLTSVCVVCSLLNKLNSLFDSFSIEKTHKGCHWMKLIVYLLYVDDQNRHPSEQLYGKNEKKPIQRKTLYDVLIKYSVQSLCIKECTPSIPTCVHHVFIYMFRFCIRKTYNFVQF